MIRTLLSLVSFAALSVGATAASAQGQGGVAPGSTDSSKASNSGREGDAFFNKLAASFDRKKAGRTVPAKPADVVAGAYVADKQGAPLGTIVAVDATNAIVRSQVGMVSVPRDVFGKNKLGLVLDVVKADFDSQVVAANAAAPKG